MQGATDKNYETVILDLKNLFVLPISLYHRNETQNMINKFNTPIYVESLSPKPVRQLFEQVMLDKPRAVMLLCCDEDIDFKTLFDPFLKAIDVPVFGGIFPALLMDKQTLEKGVVAVGLNVDVNVKVKRKLADAQQNENTFVDAGGKSMLVLVDGLSRNIDYTLNQLFEKVGSRSVIFGGGAGSLSFEQKPCLLTNDGVICDAMVTIEMNDKWDVAIGHGWDVLEGPFLANKVDDTIIQELNFEPAMDVYRRVIEAHDGRKFADHDFFDIAKAYPFGLQKLDNDLLVRDPVTYVGKDLVCVGNIPEGSMLYILKGYIPNLINAAVNAIDTNQFNGAQKHALMFDCIGRKLFMDEKSNCEIEQIKEHVGPDCSVLGAFALGEIASLSNGTISFHNKTAITAYTD